MKEYVDNLIAILKNAISNLTSDIEKAGILFSGGLDSSVLAFLLCRQPNLKVRAYVCGTQASYDLKAATSAAKMFNLPIKKIILDQQAIEDAMFEVSTLIESKNIVEIGFEMPLYFVAKNAAEKVLFSGQGADELFGGYAKYLKLSSDDLKIALNNDINNLLRKGRIREQRIARRFGKELRTPFLELKFVEYCRKIPLEYKVNRTDKKLILKALGIKLCIPIEIIERPKKAAQYSSGIMKVLKKIKMQNLSTS